MDATQTEEQVSLKLLLNKEKDKVLFAEAGKDFVDVLFSFLTMPLGTIARLVGKESNLQPVSVGCLTSLYQSVENLEEECLSTETCKEMLFLPRNSAEAYCRNMKLNIDDTEPTKYFVCRSLNCLQRESGSMLSTFKNKRCSCGKLLSHVVSLESDNVCDCEGLINSDATFIITDDLNVIPNSLGASFGLLKNLGIESMGSAHKMTVNVTKKKVLDLLKCSMLSKTTLTGFFLEKTHFLESSLPSVCDLAANGCRQIKVKIMQRKSNGKIVFAQGEEDFANFILSFLTFPLGGVVHMLEGCSSVRSVDVLYKSIVDLNENYFVTKEVKNMLVDPLLAPQFKLSNQLLPINESHAPRLYCRTIIYPGRWDSRLTSTYTNSGSCVPLDLVDPKSSKGSNDGYVKGPPTMYMVTDDLVVTTVSCFSALSLLDSVNIPLSDLEEKEVSIGVKEGLSILRASLTSTSALTNGLSHFLTKIKEDN